MKDCYLKLINNNLYLMDKKMFPRTDIGGQSVSRIFMGTNWLLGWSHTSPSADKMITDRYPTKESFLPMFQAYLDHGIDTLIGPVSQNDAILPAIQYAQEKLGKEIIIVDTPWLNVENTKEGRAEAEKQIKRSAEIGSKFCLMHQTRVEQIMNMLDEKLDRIDDYTKMIRDCGMIPGLGSHSPEIIQYCDKNGHDIETYVQIVNPVGFLMRLEIEIATAAIQRAKKPVIAIKAMAAGRVSPYVGLTFTWNAIRNKDVMAIGAFTPQEVHEDVELSLAALEGRYPDFLLGDEKIGQANDDNQRI